MSGSFTNDGLHFAIAGIGLGVGSNTIAVYGTNEYGANAGDSVTITRGPVGTGTPFVDLTNTPMSVGYTVTNVAVAGTNNEQVVGGMWVSNAANGAVAHFAGTSSWTATQLPLAVGQNEIWVIGTNALGAAAGDSVTVERLVTPPTAPTGVAASDGTYPSKVVVTWSAASNATVYAVYRNTAELPEAAEDISGETAGTSYEDGTVVPDQTYVYWVKAKNAGGWSGFSGSDQGHAGVNEAIPTFAPAFLDFSSNAATLFVTLGNEGTIPYTYSATVTTGGAWLSVNPAGGVVSNQSTSVAVEVDRSCLVDGAYTGSLLFTTSEGTGAVVTVRMAVVGNLIAEANGPYMVNQGAPVVFSAAGSKGAQASYSWRVGTNDWSGYSTNYATFVYTNTLVPEELDVLVSVCNSNTPPNETMDSTTLTILNVPPAVDIGGPYQGSNLVAIHFAAAVTDPGLLDAIEYRWDFNGDSTWDTGWLGSNTTSHTYTTGGSYIAQCEVRDNRGGAAVDTATVLIQTTNMPPVGTAVVYGTSSTVTNLPGLGCTVTLSGAGSYDPDTKPFPSLYFDWREDVANPQKPVTYETNRHEAVLTTMPLAQPGEYKFHLVVCDGEYNSKEQTVTVRVPGWRGEVICDGFLAKVPLWGVDALVTNTYTHQLKTGRTDLDGLFLADSGVGYQIALLTRRGLYKSVPIDIDADGVFTEGIYFLPNYYIYAGQVVTGTPGNYVGLDGAKLEVRIGNGLTAMTDANGWFGFGALPESWPLDGEPYEVRVQKDGFKSRVLDLLLTMNRNSEMILLEPLTGTVAVSGTVMAQGALQRVQDVTVNFGNTYQAATDTNGVFGPVSMPEGTYSVTLEKHGYDKTVVSPLVLGAGTTNLEITIHGGHASVYGSVVNGAGKVVTNATLQLETPGNSGQQGGQKSMCLAQMMESGIEDEGVVQATLAGYYDLDVVQGQHARYRVSARGYEKHECDEDRLLPVVNSPRTGQCAYTGPADASSGEHEDDWFDDDTGDEKEGS